MWRNSARPYVFQFFGRVLPQFVAIPISIVIVRFAGLEVFGKYSLLLAVLSASYVVLCSALDKDFQRSCDANRASDVLFAKLTGWALTLPLLVLLVLAIDWLTTAVIVLSIGVLFQQAVETKVTRDRIRGDDAKSIMPRLLPVLVFLGLLVWSRPESVDVIAWLFTFSWIIGLTYSLSMIKAGGLNLVNSVRQMKSVGVIAAITLMTQVYGTVDLYVLKLYHSDEVVGVFKLAYMFAALAMPVAGVFSFIYLSQVSAAYQRNDYARSRRTMRRQLFLNAALGSCVVGFITLLFPTIVVELYGQTAASTVAPASILAVAMGLNMLSMVFSYALLAMHKETMMLVVTAIGGIAYVVMAFALVPRYGASGAAMAMAAANGGLLGVYWRVYLRAASSVYKRNRSGGHPALRGPHNE